MKSTTTAAAVEQVVATKGGGIGLHRGARSSSAARRTHDCAENQLPGTPQSVWDVSGAGDATIQGFATDISVNQGETVSLQDQRHGQRPVPHRHLPDGLLPGQRRAQGRDDHRPRQSPQVQPARPDRTRRPAWSTAATGRSRRSWEVPADRDSGHLLRQARPRRHRRRQPHRLRRPQRRQALRPPLPDLRHHLAGVQRLRRQQPLRTGNSADRAGRAVKVSYNRPFDDPRQRPAASATTTRCSTPSTRWSAGSSLTATTSATSPTSTPTASAPRSSNHKVFLSVGHDEYWSAAQRANVEARATPASTSPSSAATRSSGRPAGRTASTARPRRTAPWSATRRRRPTPRSTRRADVWTGTWRDPRFSPPADGGRPENALTGTLYMVDRDADDLGIPVTVRLDVKPALLAQHQRRQPAAGQTATLGDQRRSATSGTRTSTTASGPPA